MPRDGRAPLLRQPFALALRRVAAGWLLAAAAWPFAAVPPGAAQAPPAGTETKEAVAGQWEISNAARDQRCLVTLAAPAGGRGAVSWDGKCAERFAFSRDVVAWSTGDNMVRLLDAKGQPVLELSEVESGLYEGERRGEGLVFLQSAASGAAEARKPEMFVGAWAFTRESDRPLCTVTLSTALSAAPAAPDAMALKVRPGCGAPISGFAPVAWRFDRGQLVIIPAQGEVWRFEEAEPAVWQRIPQSLPILRLVKQRP